VAGQIRRVVWSVGGDGGDIMISPPHQDHPYGRAIVGTRAQDALPYLNGQGVHGEAVELDTSWLFVGHVDEIIAFADEDTLLMPCPYLASTLIHERLALGEDGDKMPIGWDWLDAPGTTQTLAQIAIATNAGGAWKSAWLPDPGPGIPAGQPGATNVVEIPGHPFVLGDYLRIGPEILEVTAVPSLDEVRVERGVAGTDTPAHPAGARIYAYTELMVRNLVDRPGHATAFLEVSARGRVEAARTQLYTELGAYAPSLLRLPVLYDLQQNQQSDYFWLATTAK
jgi:hypothetical protein